MRGRAPGRRAATAIALGLLLAGLAAGGAGAEEAAAPALAERMAHEARDFDSYGLPVGRFGPGRRPVRVVEGALDRAAWRLDDPRASVAGVIEGYRARLAAQGFEPVWSCANEACGGFDFRFGAEIMAPPAMLIDVRDFAQFSARRAEPEAFVSVLVSRVLGAIHVQTVTVGPPGGVPELAPPSMTATAAAPRAAPAPEPGPDSQPSPASGEAAEAGGDGGDGTGAAGAAGAGAASTVQDERALLAALRRDGHVAVPGLDFDTGGVRLSAGSSAALDVLARLLMGDESLRVLIVGHSDDEGPLDLNLDLSRRRAEQVMQALVERGVPAARLEARGAGFLAPVASNASEAGRAANRRVELVLR